LFAEQRRFWLTVLIWFGASTANYGVFLWGPTIVALLLGVAPQDAAKMFIYVSLAGVLGRTGFAFLAQSGWPQAVRRTDGVWHRNFAGVGRVLP